MGNCLRYFEWVIIISCRIRERRRWVLQTTQYPWWHVWQLWVQHDQFYSLCIRVSFLLVLVTRFLKSPTHAVVVSSGLAWSLLVYVIAACNQRESHQPRLQLSEATGRRLLGNCYDCFWVYSTPLESPSLVPRLSWNTNMYCAESLVSFYVSMM